MNTMTSTCSAYVLVFISSHSLSCIPYYLACGILLHYYLACNTCSIICRVPLFFVKCPWTLATEVFQEVFNYKIKYTLSNDED